MKSLFSAARRQSIVRRGRNAAARRSLLRVETLEGRNLLAAVDLGIDALYAPSPVSIDVESVEIASVVESTVVEGGAVTASAQIMDDTLVALLNGEEEETSQAVGENHVSGVTVTQENAAGEFEIMVTSGGEGEDGRANPDDLLDANRDKWVSAIDVLIRINEINWKGGSFVIDVFAHSNVWLDTADENGQMDGVLSPSDVLRTINALNWRGGAFYVWIGESAQLDVVTNDIGGSIAVLPGAQDVLLGSVTVTSYDTVVPVSAIGWDQVLVEGNLADFREYTLTAEVEGEWSYEFWVANASDPYFFDFGGEAGVVEEGQSITYRLYGEASKFPVGTADLFQTAFVSAESFPGWYLDYQYMGENQRTVVFANMDVAINGPEGHDVLTGQNVTMAFLEFETDASLPIETDLYVQFTGIWPDGGYPEYWTDLVTEVRLIDDGTVNVGTFWGGYVGDETVMTFRLEDVLIENMDVKGLEVVVMDDVPVGVTLRAAFLAGPFTDEVIARGDRFEVVAPVGDLTVTNPGQPPARLLLGGERLGDSVLSAEFTAANGDSPVTQIVIGVTGDPGNSILWVELYGDTSPDRITSAFFSGTMTTADGQEARLFIANLPEDVLVVGDMMSTTVTARPRVLSDVMGGVSGATPKFFLYDVVGDGQVTMETVTGQGNEVVMSEVTTISNKLPARSFPLGSDQEFGRFEFVAADNANYEDGSNGVGLEGLVFTINVVNGQLENVELHRTGNSTTDVVGTLYDANGVLVVGPFMGSGTVYAVFEGLTASVVDTLINSGEAVAFSLEADFGLPPNPAQPSSVQTSLTDLNNPNAEFGVEGSHIKWHDDGVFGTEVDWLEIEDDVVGTLLST